MHEYIVKLHLVFKILFWELETKLAVMITLINVLSCPVPYNTIVLSTYSGSRRMYNIKARTHVRK